MAGIRSANQYVLLTGLAVIALAVAVGGGSADAARGANAKRPAKAPAPVPSYPLVGTQGNLAVEAANAACAFAQAQPQGRRLMLFNFGQAHYEGGEFGAGRRPFYSNDQILEALVAAANRYRDPDCHRPRTRATIAYGVTNHKLSEAGTTVGGKFAPMSPELGRAAGAEQLDVATALRRSMNRRDDAAVAGDIEPGWDPSPAGVEVGRALVRGANTGKLAYFNFGTAGHCPPYPWAVPGCGSWSWDVLGEVSQKRRAVPLPQMYHSYQAEQWNTVRERWNRSKVNKPRRCSQDPPAARCYTFAGVTSQPVECGSEFTPRQSWKLLRDAVPKGTLGDELVFYNPGQLNCSRSASRSEPARGESAFELLPRAEPARVVADPEPLVPADVLNPVANSWRAGDRRGITVVQAGLAGDDPSRTTGRLVIFRERERPFAQDVEIVDVPGAGKLRISESAATGRAARSAQRRGEIEFAGTSGVTGTLDLRHDTVAVDSE